MKRRPIPCTMQCSSLKEDVKSAIMIQRRATLDAACALALVQEEGVDSRRKKSYSRLDSSSSRMP
jgi:hypothetical protein